MNTENNYTETDLGNVAPNPKGEYNPEAAYEYLDLVNYQGGSYLCIAESETTITGIAPESGKNTTNWQMVALPGNLTPEYAAMHDDVVNKAKQAEISRTAAELAQEAAEAAQVDTEQLHTETLQAATEAEKSRDSAAGYAQSAEQSRKAASESEQNINAQVTGFEESVTQAQQEIVAARQQAVKTVTQTGEKQIQIITDNLDTTLSVEGKAADAKAVGDKIIETNKAITSLKEDLGNVISDDVIENDKTWSAKHIVEILCPTFETSGNPVQCFPIENSLLDITVDLKPVQEGSGTPYPNNVRAIKGTQIIQVQRKEDNKIFTMSLNQNIYGGSMNITTGDGQETWGLYTITGNEIIAYAGNSTFTIVSGLNDVEGTDECCSHYTSSLYNSKLEKRFRILDTGTIYIVDNDFTKREDFIKYVSEQYESNTPIQIAYKSTQTYSLVAEDIKNVTALAGVNTFSSKSEKVTISGRSDITKRITDIESAIASITNK